MKEIRQVAFWGALIAVLLAVPKPAAAQREVHWQVNPRGFPADTSIFVDVESAGVFKRDLPAAAFSVSMDEYAGDQGGWILNQQQFTSGTAGAEVLLLIDRSSSYTGEFDKARRVMHALAKYLDPARDRVAVATAPASGGFTEAKLELPFTNDVAALAKAIDAIAPLPSSDKSGARLCNALSEALSWFPEETKDRYRAIVVLTGGADKGEGKGDCVVDSYNAGLVPFFPIVLKLDRKYDDPRNSHEIENKTHELAQKTGGRSIFRKSENEYLQFAGLLWNRIRSQYQLRVMFPCFRPEPATEHWSVLKVESRDADGIKFRATSMRAPVPQITALYPPQATRKEVDDGKVELVVDGTGFCGPLGGVKVYVGDRPAMPKSQGPFRIIAPLNSTHETGRVKVINGFGQQGESAADFTIVKPPKGSEASSTLTFLVIGIVGLGVLAIVLVALRSRKAKITAPQGGAKAAAPPPAARPSAESAAAKTVAMTALGAAWIERLDGSRVDLKDGHNAIGREPTCAIQLTVAGVSREHARVEVDRARGVVWLEDLSSTNGTYWGPPNATEKDLVKLTGRRLVGADETIWIGGERLIVRLEGGVPGGKEG